MRWASTLYSGVSFDSGQRAPLASAAVFPSVWTHSTCLTRRLCVVVGISESALADLGELIRRIAPPVTDPSVSHTELAALPGLLPEERLYGCIWKDKAYMAEGFHLLVAFYRLSMANLFAFHLRLREHKDYGGTKNLMWLRSKSLS